MIILMKKVLNDKPKCIDTMGNDLFVTMPIYKELDDFSVIYVNEKLYERIFNKKYIFEEAVKDIKDNFSFTLYENGTSSIGKCYVDKQGDPTGIALNENLGSGRAYYIGSNYNIKGEKTILCTSSMDDYNNGKYPLEAAFQEAMISEVLSDIFDIDTFRVLAIIDKNEKYKFPKSKGPLSCGLLIRYYENNELYRFSHRFVNNKKFNYEEITSICKKMGIIEGNKIIHRFLHGAWSLGNLSIDCNLIDFDTSFFVKGRHPSWIFSVAHKENYFGHEDEGEKRIIDILYDNNMLCCDTSKDELYKIIDTEKYNTIIKGFLELISYDLNIYSKYKDMVDELVSLFIKLYPKMVYNYDKMNCSNFFSEKNNLFDFSNFFRFYNIYRCYHKNDDNLFNLILNSKVELYQYSSIDFEHYNAVYNFIKEDIIENSDDLEKAMEVANVFFEKFNRFNEIVDNDLKISIYSKIKKAYLRNETKRYLMATTWLRGGLCNINSKYGPKLVNNIINFVTKYYTQKDYENFNSDLIIYEEGMFYRNIKDNCYSYVFEFYNITNYKNINLVIDNNIIELFKTDNYKYNSNVINDLNLKEISKIDLIVDNQVLNLNIVDFKDNL